MLKYLIFFTLLVASIAYSADDMPAYRLYEADGDDADFGDLSDMAIESDIILFGELHNNPISHWLQLELTKYLADETMQKLTLGAEMFEADNQQIIDEYLSGLIPQKNFESECRTWANYKTDYKPIFEFARENGLKFIATNIPRRYASFVSRHGLDSLNQFSQASQAFFPPLPLVVDLEAPQYKKMKEMMQGASHGMPYLVEAQAAKDITMAYFISKNFEPDKKFIHFNGAYHSDNYEGIMLFLRQYLPSAKTMTISTVEQDDISDLDEENHNKADIIIVVPSNMTKTH